MLLELSIKNLALIESLNLSFKHGFTTLTGETGAGKSILLDALGLTLGDRADSALVRHGAKRADVTAQFDLHHLPNVQTWLEHNELELDEPHLTLRRTVSPEGRSKAYINGIPTGLSQVKELGEMLLDIHGQHEHQSLLQANKQLELLDAFATHKPLLNSVKQDYRAWQNIQQQLTQAQRAQQEYRSKLELLQFQQDELSKLDPKTQEFDDLSDELKTLSHASEIKQHGYNAYQALESDEGVTTQLQTALSAIEKLTPYLPAMEEPLAQLNSALIDIQEAANTIEHYAETVELDPIRLEEVEERLSELHAVAKKYQLEPEQLVQKREEVDNELEQLSNSGEAIEQLKIDLEKAEQRFLKSAQALSKSRLQAAQSLQRHITQGMQELGMPNGQFSITQELANASASGIDKIEFLVTANIGQPMQSISKVASGGELSRISLAIQVATAEVTSLPTMIFDEVDVGIGGGIAEIVGQKLQALGQHKQILSITHLAQVACHGDQHLKIKKHSKDEQTFTEVFALDNKERIEELGRMMGGIELTSNTLKLAKEMLKQAQSR